MAVKDDSWTVTTLKECARWYSGGTPNTSVAEYWNGDIPWITASSLHDFYIKNSERRVTPLGIAHGTRLIPKDTILFIVRGMSLKTEFRVGITRRPMAFGQDCKALVAKDGVDPLFLANVLRAKSEEILGFVDEASHGTGRLATDALEKLEILFPPLDEQKAIAHILGTLDDKIELNQQMNQTLEAIARALFKSWFIDFDPVRAKLDGRQPIGMDAETAALFPAEFEDSALGKIPKGWEIKPFGELLDLTIGGDWGKETPDEKHTQLIAIIRGTDIASIKAGIFSKIPHRYTTSQKIKNRALSDGDIIIEVSGGSPDQPTGRSCYITNSILEKLDSVVVPASFCRLFRPKNSLLGIILKLHLEVLYEQGGTWVYQNQSTGISNFQTQYFLANELVLIPTPPIQKLFFNTIRPIVNKQASDENFVLSQIRDALLPKLLSGEIRVQDAETVVEAVT